MASSEEVKQFVSVVVIMYIVYRILDALSYPLMRMYRWSKKKTIQLMKAKGPIPKVPQPLDQLKELLIVYFINGLTKGDMKAKFKVKGPKTLHKAIEIGKIYEDMLNNNNNVMNNTEFVTPPGYSLIETPTSSNPKQSRVIQFTQNT